MQKKIYSVILYSGLGERKGKLSVNISGESCEGFLYIMENENHFCGRFIENKWKLYGSLKTGIWDTEYEATGYFSENNLTFQFLILGCKYELKGEILE